jgi:hopanoid biosynthesis associated protein HpnK
VKFLIITADDFGLDAAVNRAVEQAVRGGVLSAASLMVGAPAADEAVRLAKELPRLRVGLHLVLTDGWPALPASELSELVGPDGRFPDQMTLDSFRYCFSQRMREQVRAEIRAQFQAFASTGLILDHVNAHKHFHIHPWILREILAIGREFAIPAVRIPNEPLWFSGRRALTNYLTAPLLRPWLAFMRGQLRRNNIRHNDQVFGVACSGALDEETLLSVLAHLPEGITEIYLHPAIETERPLTDSMRHYRHADELAALLSPRVRDALADTGALCGGFREAVCDSVQARAATH